MQLKQALRRVPGAVAFKRRLDRALGRKRLPPMVRPRSRGQPVGVETATRSEPRRAGPASFVLYRIIGNDLVPRHRRHQSRDNLRFILEHESELSGCEKRFVVNRIVDAEEEATILGMLDDAGLGYVRIPFDAAEYAAMGWDVWGIPPEYAPHRFDATELDEEFRLQVLGRLARYRNNYVMNNNGARNAALADGRGRADWILPFDGNCFFTERAWLALRSAVESRLHLPYHIVPMARITDNDRLLDPDHEPVAGEEPQVLFRCDADLRFDEAFYYGRRPKVELLWRLGVPGPWDDWPVRPWDLPCPDFASEAGQFGDAGWVARLHSGQAHLETGGAHVFFDRGAVRSTAVLEYLDDLDARHAPPFLNPSRPVFVRTSATLAAAELGSGLDHALREAADAALTRGPYSVVDKTTLPPSGDRHDYWHPAPYYWPNPVPLPGLPYVRRDGQRVPGTQLYEAGSEQYDRTRLQRLFDDTFVLALASGRFGRAEYGQHAARLVTAWFLDPATAMNPHLIYAQVRRGHHGNRGAHTGVIEFKDFYYFLDAVRLLEADGFLTSVDGDGFRKWLRRYVDWLRTSPQGQGERAARNNHGTYYDLQVAAIAAFLGDYFLLRDTLRDSRLRIVEQFSGDGHQPDELKRRTTAHYCCFNLQGWVHLAELAAAHGEDLWSFEGPDGQGLRPALDWLLAHVGRPWPFEQIDAFDEERFLPLHYACVRQFGEAATPVRVSAAESVKPLFFPHDGIRPFWQVV